MPSQDPLRGIPVDVPNRSRFWPITITVVILFAVCGYGLLEYRAHLAKRFLETRIAEIRAFGEPIDAEDFRVAQPDYSGANAADLIRLADLKLNNSLRESAKRPGASTFRRALESPESMAGFVRNNRDSIELLRRAVHEASCVDWGTHISSPMVGITTNRKIDARGLGHLICIAAIDEANRGELSRSVETLIEAMTLASIVRDDSGVNLIDQLTSMGIEAKACNAFQIILPAIRQALTDGTDDASRDRIASALREYQRTLMDDKQLRASRVAAYQLERAMVLDTWKYAAKGRNPATPSGAAPSLAAYVNPVTRKRIHDSFIELESYWTWYIERNLTEPPRDGDVPFPFEEFSESNNMTFLLPGTARVELFHRHAVANRRMAAIAIGAVLFERDHERLPASQAELVPEYLVSIQRDPFSRSRSEPIRIEASEFAERVCLADDPNKKGPRVRLWFGLKDRHQYFYLNGPPADEVLAAPPATPQLAESFLKQMRSDHKDNR